MLGPQELEEAGRDPPREPSVGGAALQHLGFGLPASRRMRTNFCCSRPPRVWPFVTTAQETNRVPKPVGGGAGTGVQPCPAPCLLGFVLTRSTPWETGFDLTSIAHPSAGSALPSTAGTLGLTLMGREGPVTAQPASVFLASSQSPGAWATQRKRQAPVQIR